MSFVSRVWRVWNGYAAGCAVVALPRRKVRDRFRGYAPGGASFARILVSGNPRHCVKTLVIQGSLEPSSHQGIAHCREGPVTAGQSHRRTSSGIAVPATRTFEARPLNDNESNVEISLGSNDGFEVFSITY